MGTNHVVKKKIFDISVRFVSPVSISSGEEGLTDSDVLRDYDGCPFIPGSTLAGALRGYLNKKKTEKCIFGYSTWDDLGKMSSVFVSDLIFENELQTVTRDSVALSENKIAVDGAKFDMETVDSGAQGSFMLEMVIREEDDENDMECQLFRALSGFQNHEIRLGTKKTRGYGELEITAVREKEYTKENIRDYAGAYDRASAFKGEKAKSLPELLKRYEGKIQTDGMYTRLEADMKLTGGISIRQYQAKKGEPDFAHITANGKPVISGTSLAGAVRHRIKEILMELEIKNPAGIIDEMFGYVDKKAAHISGIVFSERVIEDAVPLTMVRTGISRFESSAKSGSLYSERAYIGGTVKLSIDVKKDTDHDWKLALLLLALKDIGNGYLPIGGQTAIGRGIFELSGAITLDGKEIDEEKYLSRCLESMRRAVSC